MYVYAFLCVFGREFLSSVGRRCIDLRVGWLNGSLALVRGDNIWHYCARVRFWDGDDLVDLVCLRRRRTVYRSYRSTCVVGGLCSVSEGFLLLVFILK